MIRIHCPGCERTLEVDEGFAGGVCRCSECGTMMTVPASRSARAQQVERPPRPDSPVADAPAVAETADADADADADGNADVDDGDIDVDVDMIDEMEAPSEATAVSRTGRGGGDRGRRGAKRKGRRGKGRDRATETEPAEAPATATAPSDRRSTNPMVIRVAVIAAVVIVLGGLSVVTIMAISNLTGSGSGETTWTRRPVPDARVTDNPFAMTQPNLFGMSMPRGAVSVVIDSDQPVREVLPQVGRLMNHGGGTMADGALLQAVIVDGVETMVVPASGLSEASAWESEALSSALADPAEREPTAGSDMLEGIDRAMVANPDRVVMVVGVGPRTDVLNQWAKLMNTTRPTLDIVQVGPQSDQRLAELAERFGGRYRHIVPSDLRQWDEAGE